MKKITKLFIAAAMIALVVCAMFAVNANAADAVAVDTTKVTTLYVDGTCVFNGTLSASFSKISELEATAEYSGAANAYEIKMNKAMEGNDGAIWNNSIKNSVSAGANDSIVLNLNGKRIQGGGNGVSIFSIENTFASFKIMNGRFYVSKEHGFPFLDNFNKAFTPVELSNVDIEWERNTSTQSLIRYTTGGSLKLDDVQVSVIMKDFSTQYIINSWGPSKIDINNCSFKQDTLGRSLTAVSAKGTTTVKNTKFETDIAVSGQNITLGEGTQIKTATAPETSNSVYTIPAGYEWTKVGDYYAVAKAFRINFNNLSFKDSVYLKFAIKSELAASDVKMLVWTSAPAGNVYTVDTANATIVNPYVDDTTVVAGERYLIFDYTKITPDKMGTDFYFSAYYMDGETPVYTPVVKSSVLSYATDMLGKDTTSESLKNMLTAMLNYGAMAQIYRENTDTLVNVAHTKVTVKNGTLSDGLTYGLFAEGETVELVADAANFSHWECNGVKIEGSSATYSAVLGAITGAAPVYTAVYK